MSQPRTLATLVLLAVVLPVSAAPRQPFVNCDRLRLDLAQRAQALRQQHDTEMAQCTASNGEDSQACSDLKELQLEDRRQLKAYTNVQLRSCSLGPFFSESPHLYHQFYSQSAVYYPHHPHHPHYPQRHDGINGGWVRDHAERDHAVRADGRREGSHFSAASRASSGHPGGSFGHSSNGSGGYSTSASYAGRGGSGGGFSGGHSGYSGGGGSSGSGRSGGFSGGSGGGGSGYSGGHSGGSSGGSASSGSSSGGGRSK